MQLSQEAELIESFAHDPGCNVEALKLSAQSLQSLRRITLKELERELFPFPIEAALEQGPR